MEYSYLLFPGFKRKCLTLSYDDGVVEDVKLCDIMQKNGLKGTFNLNSGSFAHEEGTGRLTKQQAISLYNNSNFEVAVHGSIHRDLTKLSSSAVLKDVLLDREELEKIYNSVIRGMAYAYGTYNDHVVELVKSCGIKYARTINSTHSFDLPKNFLTWHPTCHHDDPKLFELLDNFLNHKEHWVFPFNKPMVFYLWGHSYEFKDNNNWDRIETFSQKAGGNKEVWYATNIEIYNYVTAYDRLEFSVDESLVYNPTDQDIYLNMRDKKVIARKNTTTKIK